MYLSRFVTLDTVWKQFLGSGTIVELEHSEQSVLWLGTSHC